jgi:hypothetical protein
MPARKSVWLYDYDHVKYRTGVQWAVSFVAGFAVAAIGSIGVWAAVIRYRSGHGIDIALLSISAACIAIAIIEVPAAVVYFCRRRRGEPTGYFDCEVIEHEKGGNGAPHGPDHR